MLSLIRNTNDIMSNIGDTTNANNDTKAKRKAKPLAPVPHILIAPIATKNVNNTIGRYIIPIVLPKIKLFVSLKSTIFPSKNGVDGGTLLSRWRG